VSSAIEIDNYSLLFEKKSRRDDMIIEAINLLNQNPEGVIHNPFFTMSSLRDFCLSCNFKNKNCTPSGFNKNFRYAFFDEPKKKDRF